MTKPKKIILIVIAVIFGLLTLCNSLYLGIAIWTLNDMQVNFYGYFPFLTPTDEYINIDDVSYIRYDGVFPDPEKSANGEIRMKSRDEVYREYTENYGKYENQTPEPAEE